MLRRGDEAGGRGSFGEFGLSGGEDLVFDPIDEFAMAEFVGEDIVVNGEGPAQVLAIGVFVEGLHLGDVCVDRVGVGEEAFLNELFGSAMNQSGNFLEIIFGVVLGGPKGAPFVFDGDGLDVGPSIGGENHAAGGHVGDFVVV